MPVKRNFQYIKLETKNIIEGYECLATEYINNTIKIPFKCSKGHIFYKSWNGFQQNYICSFCSKKRRKSIEEIKEYAIDNNYICLSDDYENTYSKIKVKCPNNHIYKTRVDIFTRGHKCRKCYYESISLLRSGENHYNWQGGKTFEPYCIDWTKEYKDYIKERDGYKCLNPCCKNNSKNLICHHINYNKKDCDPFNVITLCNSCNVEANFNRGWHKKWYEAIIYRRYIRKENFKCR